MLQEVERRPAPVASQVADAPEESNSTDSAADTVAAVIDENVSPVDDTFFTTKSARQLPVLFEKFKEGDSYGKDVEFWETIYIDRRIELGIGNEASDLTDLASANPGWVWPLILMIRRCMRLYDGAEAERLLAQALARNNPKHRVWVLREGITLYFRLYGVDRAFSFLHEQISAGLSDTEIQGMMSSLADHLYNDSDAAASSLLREIALTYDYRKTKSRFDLAYAYGEHDSYLLLSYHHYNIILEIDDNYSAAWNNIGVILKNVGDAEQNIAYEQAISAGSIWAAANLAKKLVAAGFIDRAEKLLDSMPESKEDEENVFQARKEISAARKNAERNRKRFDKFAESEFIKYKSAVIGSFARFKETGRYTVEGSFSSDDATLGLICSPTSALCVYKKGTKNLVGTLNAKPFCYEGRVAESPEGLLSERQRIMVVPVNDDELKAILPPNSFSISDPIHIVTLKRRSMDQEKSLPAPAEN